MPVSVYVCDDTVCTCTYASKKAAEMSRAIINLGDRLSSYHTGQDSQEHSLAYRKSQASDMIKIEFCPSPLPWFANGTHFFDSNFVGSPLQPRWPRIADVTIVNYVYSIHKWFDVAHKPIWIHSRPVKDSIGTALQLPRCKRCKHSATTWQNAKK